MLVDDVGVSEAGGVDALETVAMMTKTKETCKRKGYNKTKQFLQASPEWTAGL